MKWRPYPRYKDSGVEWLGEVPEHWEVAPLKHWISRNDGGVWGDDSAFDNDPIVLRSTEQGVGGEWQITEPARRKLTASDIAKGLLIEGDLLVTKSSGSDLHIGKTSLVTAEVASLKPCFSNFMQRLRVSSDASPQFIHYILNNRIAREQLTFLSNSTTGLANLNGGMIGQLLLSAPDVAAQRAIAAFLDRETAKLDTLIARQERLIELLQEKRQALISHAVTKGLNPDAPMKDSGVEWLGQVPAHWDLFRLGVLFREAAEEGNDELPVLRVSIHDGVSDREFDDDELDRKVTRSDDRSKYKRVQPGDLVYNMMRAWQGGFGSVAVPGMVSPAYVVARPNARLITEFIEQVLRTPQAVEKLRRHSHGVTDFRLRLYWDEFKSIKVSVPPLQEQQAIMGLVREETAKIEKLIAKSRRSIDLMREHRTALISATVTGKIDVREAA